MLIISIRVFSMFFCSVVNTAVLSCICFSVAECDSGFGFVDEIANGLRPSIAPDVDARVVGLIADCLGCRSWLSSYIFWGMPFLIMLCKTRTDSSLAEWTLRTLIVINRYIIASSVWNLLCCKKTAFPLSSIWQALLNWEIPCSIFLAQC